MVPSRAWRRTAAGRRPAPSSRPASARGTPATCCCPTSAATGSGGCGAPGCSSSAPAGSGSPALLYLAAAGVGTLGVVDDDVVDATNLQRQVIHGVADVGRPKTESAADAVHASTRTSTVVQHDVRLDSANALEVVADYDLVLDGADNFPTRYLVNDACARLGVPHVWGSVYN